MVQDLNLTDNWWIIKVTSKRFVLESLYFSGRYRKWWRWSVPFSIFSKNVRQHSFLLGEIRLKPRPLFIEYQLYFCHMILISAPIFGSKLKVNWQLVDRKDNAERFLAFHEKLTHYRNLFVGTCQEAKSFRNVYLLELPGIELVIQ